MIAGKGVNQSKNIGQQFGTNLPIAIGYFSSLSLEPEIISRILLSILKSPRRTRPELSR